MYDNIKEHNISRNKIIEQNNANMIRMIDDKIEGMFDKFKAMQEDVDE